jgi:hypothetical protein
MVKDAHVEKREFGGISNFNGMGQNIYSTSIYKS